MSALEAAARPGGSYRFETIRALLAEAHRRGREVITPTVVCAEVARAVPAVRVRVTRPG